MGLGGDLSSLGVGCLHSSNCVNIEIWTSEPRLHRRVCESKNPAMEKAGADLVLNILLEHTVNLLCATLSGNPKGGAG